MSAAPCFLSSDVACIWPARQSPQPPRPSAGPAAASPATGAGDCRHANWAQTLERIATGVVHHPDRQHARLRYGVEYDRAGDRLRDRREARPHPDESPRGHAGSGHRAGHLPEPRGGAALSRCTAIPVHDFGIYRYDPAKLRFIQPAELPLYPAGAVIGREIRVVGNDAGEQLSILAGTLARLDREAPEYGYGKYNDFNTFYYQAASGTSGGSSGSPVIDIEGRVVALNAGGATGAASSFYLPLPAVTRALKFIDAGKPVPRGTLETVFKYTPYDELRRLGLERSDRSAHAQRLSRSSRACSWSTRCSPVRRRTACWRPATSSWPIDGKPVPEFFALEDVLDNHVATEVKVEVQRGSATLQHALEVQSLSSITADEYIEFGEAVVHALSYQQARHYNVPIKGVYVANPGYVFGSAGIPRGALHQLVQRQDNRARSPDFEAALAGSADGARAPVRYVTLEDPRAEQLKVIRMDRRWFPARKCKRDDTLGIWPCVETQRGTAAAARCRRPPRNSQRPAIARIDRLAPSLVMVTFDMPYSVSGVTEKNYHGTGLIVDAERGLVVVDRNTVPRRDGRRAHHLQRHGRGAGQGGVHSSAAQSRRRLLRSEIHRHDAGARGDAPRPRTLRAGDDVWVVGQRSDSKVMSQRTQVASVDAVAFPLSRTLRFRDSNLEA